MRIPRRCIGPPKLEVAVLKRNRKSLEKLLGYIEGLSSVKIYDITIDNDNPDKEIWKEIRFYPRGKELSENDWNYSVSNFGKVKLNSTNEIIPIHWAKGEVKLKFNKKTNSIKVAKLVAYNFLPYDDEFLPCDDEFFKYVLHIEKDKFNLRYDNLFYCNKKDIKCIYVKI